MKVLLDSVLHAGLGTYENPRETGFYRLLLPSEIDALGRRVQGPELVAARFVDESPAAARALLKPDDVLLPAKGGRYAATLVTQELSGYVASSGFFILRPDQSQLLSAYLVAYLNHPYTQRRLRGLTNASTTVPVLNKADLLATTIDLPPLPVQYRLASLYQLWLHEQELTEQLLQQKAVLYQQAFLDALSTSTDSLIPRN